jgi:virulence plasmid B protein
MSSHHGTPLDHRPQRPGRGRLSMDSTRLMVLSVTAGWRGARRLAPVRRPATFALALLLLTGSWAVVSAAAPRAAGAAEPPPGGLVASASDFGWTQGEFSVGRDGAAQYRVPLWMPAGRGRVAPGLSLSYTSHDGNGYLGVGWSLDGLSSIAWCTRTIAQDGITDGGHFDGADPLCLDGNRLVPMSPPQLPQREYSTERETFARITAFGTEDDVPDYVKVWTRDGTILTFGQTTDSRVDAYQLRASTDLNEPSLVRAPGARVTTAWALNRIEDRNSNVATVEYARAEGDAAGLWWAQLRPSAIRYAPNRSVQFVYETSPRPDPIDGFAGGTHTRIDVRLSRIEMRGGPQGGTAELLRQYKLAYQANSITGRSLLNMVSECDHDGTCKLPLTFDYSLGSYDFEYIDAGNAGVQAYVGLTVGDVDGDGRSDLLHQGENGYVIQRSTATGFTAPVASGLPPLVPEGLRAVNVDGDGRLDVVAPVREDSGGVSGYRWRLYQSNGSTLVAAPGTLDVWRRGFGDDVADPVYFADFDGSGVPDFASAILDQNDTFGPWYYRLNTGAAGAGRFAARVDTTVTPSNSPFGNDTFAVDTDGDGRAELITMAHPGPDLTPPMPQPGWAGWGLVAGAGNGVEGNTHNVWGHSVHDPLRRRER